MSGRELRGRKITNPSEAQKETWKKNAQRMLEVNRLRRLRREAEERARFGPVLESEDKE